VVESPLGDLRRKVRAATSAASLPAAEIAILSR